MSDVRGRRSEQGWISTSHLMIELMIAIFVLCYACLGINEFLEVQL